MTDKYKPIKLKFKYYQKHNEWVCWLGFMNYVIWEVAREKIKYVLYQRCGDTQVAISQMGGDFDTKEQAIQKAQDHFDELIRGCLENG